MRYIEVKKIIDKWDPLHLWCCGCPEDEYDSEIEDIRKEVKKNDDIEHITKYLYDMFINSGYYIFIEGCREIAEKISLSPIKEMNDMDYLSNVINDAFGEVRGRNVQKKCCDEIAGKILKNKRKTINSIADIINGTLLRDEKEIKPKAMEKCREIAEEILNLDRNTVIRHFCPYLNRKITDHYCCNMNMLAFGWGGVSPNNRMFRKDNIKRDTAASFCENCENLQMGKDEFEESVKHAAGMQVLLEQAQNMLEQNGGKENGAILSGDDLLELNELADELKTTGFLHSDIGSVKNPEPIKIED